MVICKKNLITPIATLKRGLGHAENVRKNCLIYVAYVLVYSLKVFSYFLYIFFTINYFNGLMISTYAVLMCFYLSQPSKFQIFLKVSVMIDFLYRT